MLDGFGLLKHSVLTELVFACFITWCALSKDVLKNKPNALKQF